MSDPQKANFLLLATNKKVQNIVRELCPQSEFELIQSEDEFDEKFDEYDDSNFAAIICSTEINSEFSLEVAQILRNQCPRTPSFFVCFDKELYQPTILKKNGFSEAYLLPIDSEDLKNYIVDCVKPETLAAKNYKAIRILDLKPESQLDFDTYVFLPLNSKYVKLSNKNDVVTEKKLTKLNEHNLNSLHIEQKDMSAFYDYTANQLKDIAQGTGPMSATERDEKLRESVRTLFSSIFDQSKKSDFDSGKEMLGTCQNIISTYITGNSEKNWYNQIISTIGGSMGGYSHASNTSTYGAMFALGIGHEAPEDLALAGFLHDLSLSDFPEDLLDIPEEEWPEDQLKAYKEHPVKTLNIIKQRKMIITPNVEKAILQHHEMFSGKGFPNASPGNKIHEDAQILSFADQFDKLTSKKEGEKAMNPLEACSSIEKNGSIAPIVINKIKKLFQEKEAS